MIKKIFLTLLIICALVSCGKKGDPQYKESKKNTKLSNTIFKI
tara:strand:+ start:1377 stop:1505 length:129 start_codon:yes stop_codon:yes gene_type:complete